MGKNTYFLQCDIRKFFPTIDHEILKTTFRRLVKDAKILRLMDFIVDFSNEQEEVFQWFFGDVLWAPRERRKGLPIGNLTSQWFANWQLNAFDHFVTGELGIGAYVRYCDDFILLHNDRDVLKAAIPRLKRKLAGLRLKVHEEKTFVRPVRSGLTFVGYRTWRAHRLVRKENVRRFRRRVRWMRREYADGRIGWGFIRPRIDAWVAHARHAASRLLIARLGREWIFRKGRSRTVGPCPARRLLEQQSQELPVGESQQEPPGQSQQQHRVSVGPALPRAMVRDARNRPVYGSGGSGFGSPGFAPAPPRSPDGTRAAESAP